MFFTCSYRGGEREGRGGERARGRRGEKGERAEGGERYRERKGGREGEPQVARWLPLTFPNSHC